MTIQQINAALAKKGYRIEKACKCAGMYDIFFKQLKVAYLYNSPSKGCASLKLLGVDDNTPKQIDTPSDFFWYLV